MFPFWKPAVLPLLRSASATRIVEIGALRGENTDLMLADLDDDVELHVIDPLPEFDPAVHEAAWPKRYVFHRALSLDVLSSLPPMDAALIDGDHNWYTVRNELQQLTDVATAAGRPMPMMILHDVGWPYGRRDLYYDPGNIPDEFRQPYRRAGMLPGRSDLVDNGGLNPDMANATHEGGERNGVMTAVDDFVREHPEPIRVVFLPVYFGLAILVEEAVVERTPKLQWHLDRLEGLRGKDQLMALAERTRLRAMIFQHAAIQRADRRHDELAGRVGDVAIRAIGDDPDRFRELRAALSDAPGGSDIAMLGIESPELLFVTLIDHHVRERAGDVLVTQVAESVVADAASLCARFDTPTDALRVLGAPDSSAFGNNVGVCIAGPGLDGEVIGRMEATGVPIVRP